MKKIRYGINWEGKVVVVLIIDDNKVKVLSQEARFADLNGKTLDLRVREEVGDIVADGRKAVKLGEVGYPDAVIDTLEEMGYDVVG